MLSQEQLIHSNRQSFDIHAENGTRLRQLINQSLETLEAILIDESVPAKDRAFVALEILERVGRVSDKETSVAGLQVSNYLNEGIRDQQTKLSLEDSALLPAIAPLAQSSAPIQTTASEKGNILPINFIQIDNFLTSEELEQAIQISFGNQTHFTDSLVHNKKQESVRQYRQSTTLHHKHYKGFADLFQQKILAILPLALNELKHPQFEVSNTVVQLTAHNDGCYYTLHSDANTEATQTREITYVYYFYREPKAFSGGELRMYETGVNGQSLFKGAKFEDIEPHNNSIVFFPSRLLHEVMPVSCPSKEFKDSRFTFNGWIRR